MSYYLEQMPVDYCPIEERERKLENILVAAQQDRNLFLDIEEEIIARKPTVLTALHHEAFNGVDIRKSLDMLFEEVVEECLIEDVNYFGE